MALIDRGRVMSDYLENLGRMDSYKAKYEALVKAVDNAPSIDAVPVVRCNMCKYYEAEVGFCHYHDHGMHCDDFCSRVAKMDLEG